MSEENIVTGEGFMDDWDYEYQKRIAELEAQLAEKDAEISRLREFFKSEIAHMETWERNAMAARFKKALQEGDG
jgi:uncharacterized coiled-coil protein SlyX